MTKPEQSHTLYKLAEVVKEQLKIVEVELENLHPSDVKVEYRTENDERT